MGGITVICAVIFTFTLVSKCNATNKYDVIIIGAGASGIAAATKLSQHGVDDIRVLEAQDRIGGRIRSVEFGDAFVDLGAEWVQKDDNDVVYNLAKDFNILKEVSSKNYMIYSDGACIDTKISSDLLSFYHSLKIRNKTEDEKKLSFGELFLKDYHSVILEKYYYNPSSYKICLDAINTFENIVDGRQGSFSWFNLTTATTFKEPKGKPLVWDGLGFKTILDIMMDKYPNPNKQSPIDGKILLNKEVVRIDWSSDSVTLQCKDGSEYLSDYVIFTLSAGVLKAKEAEMFWPSLPEEKKVALRKFGFGSLMKVMLHFPLKWWLNDFEGANLIWREEDLESLTIDFPYGPVKNNASWLSGIYSIIPAENNPNVLIAWFSGQLIPDLENTSDDIIKDGVMYIIKKFYGKTYNVTLPDKILHSSWYSDPFALGVYAYESMECHALDYNCNEALASPLVNSMGQPKVFFAGEATNSVHYGLVSGAIETGYREAENILKFFEM